jgi:hypothetical protein
VGTDISGHSKEGIDLLRLAAGTAFLVAVPLIAGVWLVDTSNQLAGMVTITIGVVLAIFMMAVIFSSPPMRAGRMGPSPD